LGGGYGKTRKEQWRIHRGGWGAPAPLQAATSIGTRELEEEKVKREKEEEEEEGFSPPYGCDLDPPLLCLC